MIDARFNKVDLVARIRILGSLRDQVDVRQQRAVDLIRTLNRRKRPILLYVDPPYVTPGEELYMTEHLWPEHATLFKVLSESPHRWILTYDADDRTRKLYSEFRCLGYGISHSAQQKRVGKEFMFFSRALKVSDQNVLGDAGTWV